MIDLTQPPAPPARPRGGDALFKVLVVIYFVVAALVAIYSLGFHFGIAIGM